jgi:cytochrome c oxidase assembly protein subunit 15
MSTSTQNSWLRRFSKLTCYCTLFLIFAGGMVTSTGSGLSVPDWPLSYGTLFPPMIGGIFYEHGHRMIASCVGFFTLILALWIQFTETRKWIKVLGFCALGAVILQGVLGGITVLFFLPTAVSVSHGVLAQTFFVLTIFIAYSLSNERKFRQTEEMTYSASFIKFTIFFIFLIYIQLIFAALMRHTDSGLAIYDFPKMAGEWLPKFNEATIAKINNWRFINGYEDVTIAQVMYHLTHRVGALIIFISAGILNFIGINACLNNKRALNTLFLLNTMIFIQILLGITAVLTEKSPIPTSIHVATGAAILGISCLLLLRTAPLKYSTFIKIIAKKK